MNITKEQRISIGGLTCNRTNFQHQKYIVISFVGHNIGGARSKNITKENLLQMSVFYAVYHAINADWLNDRDQFLCPKEKHEYNK